MRAVSTEFLTQVMARFPSGPQEMTKLPLEHVRDWASPEASHGAKHYVEGGEDWVAVT